MITVLSKNSEHSLRKTIRAELAAGNPKNRISRAMVAVSAALMLVLLPGIAILIHLWIAGGFTDPAAFLHWLVKCTGADCP